MTSSMGNGDINEDYYAFMQILTVEDASGFVKERVPAGCRHDDFLARLVEFREDRWVNLPLQKFFYSVECIGYILMMFCFYYLISGTMPLDFHVPATAWFALSCIALPALLKQAIAKRKKTVVEEFDRINGLVVEAMTAEKQ